MLDQVVSWLHNSFFRGKISDWLKTQQNYTADVIIYDRSLSCNYTYSMSHVQLMLCFCSFPYLFLWYTRNLLIQTPTVSLMFSFCPHLCKLYLSRSCSTTCLVRNDSIRLDIFQCLSKHPIEIIVYIMHSSLLVNYILRGYILVLGTQLWISIRGFR